MPSSSLEKLNHNTMDESAETTDSTTVIPINSNYVESESTGMLLNDISCKVFPHF